MLRGSLKTINALEEALKEQGWECTKDNKKHSRAFARIFTYDGGFYRMVIRSWHDERTGEGTIKVGKTTLVEPNNTSQEEAS